MPSPDATPYVDLTLYDKDAEDIYLAARAAIAAKFPGWTDDEAQLASVFLQALAIEVADLGVMVNRLPGAVLDGLLQLFGVTRSLGSPATATVTFTLADTLGHTIPAGSRVRYDPGTGADVVDFTTDANLVVAPASATGTTAVTGVANTSAGNGLAVGTVLAPVDALAYVNAVTLATSPTGGTDQEVDADYFTRGVQTLSRLVTTLVRPEHFTAAALDLTTQGVYRATTVSRSDGSGATVNGHVFTAVCGIAGALLSGPQKAAILAVLQGQASVELTAHVGDPAITTQNVVATVVHTAGYDTATVQASVVAALTAFLSPDTWEWGGTIRFYDLVALIEGVDGVDHITSLTTPAADVALAGVAPLAKLGTATITVT